MAVLFPKDFEFIGETEGKTLLTGCHEDSVTQRIKTMRNKKWQMLM